MSRHKRHFLRGAGSSHRIIIFGVREDASALKRRALVLLPLPRSMRIQSDLVDRLFNSGNKRSTGILLLMAEFGKPIESEELVSNSPRKRCRP